MAKVSGSGLLLLLAATLCISLPAQTVPDVFTRLELKKPNQGIVSISQDANIRNLVNLHLQHMKTLRGVMGYRIAIFSESGQEANKLSEQAKAKFISKYEEIKSDRVFDYPFYKVYVGDFRTKSEALKFLKKIEYEYPDAFITPPTMISFPN
jgi:hypothetical protein